MLWNSTHDDAVAQVDQRCAGILLDGSTGALQIGENDDAGPLLDLLVTMFWEIEKEVPGASVFMAVLIQRGCSRGPQRLDIRGQLAAFFFDAVRYVFKAQRIPELERSEFIRVAPAHGPIDLNNAIRYFGDHRCRINK